MKKVAAVFRSRMLAEHYVRMHKHTGDLEEARSLTQDVRSLGFRLPRVLGHVSLEEDRVKGIKIVIEPDLLISGLWLQLARKLTGPAAVRTCRYCGFLFEAGPGTSKRADATFCCSDHSVRFHSLKRSEGA